MDRCMSRVGIPVLLAIGAASACQACGETGQGAADWRPLGQNEAVIFSYKRLSTLPSGHRLVDLRMQYRLETPEGLAARERIGANRTPPAMLATPAPSKPVGGAVILVEIDCAARRQRQTRQVLLAEDGSELESLPGDPNPKWQAIEEGMVMDAVRQAVCP